MGLARIGRVKVDMGATDGLSEGDFLTVQRGGDRFYRRLRVVSVADNACMADECYPGESEHPLKPGQSVVAVKSQAGE